MPENKQKEKSKRAPVIVVMGHIDHGKSTLLDYIRESSVVADEAGGITQHIAAYEVAHMRDGEDKKITFIDTPGHAAFSAMRSHGARVADIAILVVAADDGVKDQTIEAYKAIQEAGIPLIVAVNKIDKPDADVNKTISSLIEHEIYLEGYGGDIPHTAISSKTGEGVEELLDVILLVAELEELSGDTEKDAEGVVIETEVDPRRGTSATLIIKDGTLKQSDCIRAGTALSPVRIMENFKGERITEASFSSPVRVTGFDKVPETGGQWRSYTTKNKARADVEGVEEKERGRVRTEYPEDVFVLPVVLKTDVRGSIEAVKKEIRGLEKEGVVVRFVSEGVGAVTENDVRNASAGTPGVVVGFNVKQEESARVIAERLGIAVGMFSIIYEIRTWLEDIIEQQKPKKLDRETSGAAKILKTFSRSGKKQVVGGRVKEGSLKEGFDIVIVRRGEEIGEGVILELQQQKARVSEVSEKSEFGANIETRIEIASGDEIEAYTYVEK